MGNLLRMTQGIKKELQEHVEKVTPPREFLSLFVSMHGNYSYRS